MKPTLSSLLNQNYGRIQCHSSQSDSDAFGDRSNGKVKFFIESPGCLKLILSQDVFEIVTLLALLRKNTKWLESVCLWQICLLVCGPALITCLLSYYVERMTFSFFLKNVRRFEIWREVASFLVMKQSKQLCLVLLGIIWFHTTLVGLLRTSVAEYRYCAITQREFQSYNVNACVT